MGLTEGVWCACMTPAMTRPFVSSAINPGASCRCGPSHDAALEIEFQRRSLVLYFCQPKIHLTQLADSEKPSTWHYGANRSRLLSRRHMTIMPCCLMALQSNCCAGCASPEFRQQRRCGTNLGFKGYSSGSSGCGVSKEWHNSTSVGVKNSVAVDPGQWAMANSSHGTVQRRRKPVALPAEFPNLESNTGGGYQPGAH